MNGKLYLNSEDGIFEGWQPLFQIFAVHDQLQSFQQTFPCQIVTAANTTAEVVAGASFSLFFFSIALFTTATL